LLLPEALLSQIKVHNKRFLGRALPDPLEELQRSPRPCSCSGWLGPQEGKGEDEIKKEDGKREERREKEERDGPIILSSPVPP